MVNMFCLVLSSYIDVRLLCLRIILFISMRNPRNEREIERLLEDVSTPESSQNEDDLYQDEGEYDSDENYQPDYENESSSSDEEFFNISRRRVLQPTPRLSSSSFSDSNEVNNIILVIIIFIYMKLLNHIFLLSHDHQ